MITILSGTNRSGSNSFKVAKEYHRIITEKGQPVSLYSLENLDVTKRGEDFIRFEKEVIIPANHLLFIVPEYNGSFPGVLKMLFDTGESHSIWFHKKAFLTGVSTGRAGNLRGMDHLADILNYLKITTHPNKLPISSVDKLMDEEVRFNDPATLQSIDQQINEFIVLIK